MPEIMICCSTSLPLQALWVYMINIAFSVLAILHMTYLGSVFNSSVDYMEEDEVRSACRSYITQ